MKLICHSILDQGFIRIVDLMGDDSAVVQAARVSYGEGTKTKSDDRALIRYLVRNKHTSPFEMCEIKLHIKCPIFVARQWLRHRTASVNEYSARYSQMPGEWYIPQLKNMNTQDSANKQARTSDVVFDASDWVKKMKQHFEDSHVLYRELLGVGVAREIARTVLPVSTYTQFYWKINLHNLLHFLSLRIAKESQYEIRVYAETILEKIVKEWVPITYEAFNDFEIKNDNT